MKLIFSKILSAAALSAPLLAGAATFQFNADLAGTKEVPPNAAVATGIASLSYNDFNTPSLTDDRYDFTMSAFGLTGNATGFHIHALATPSQNAPIIVSLAASPFVNLNGFGALLVGGDNVAPPATVPTSNGFPEQTFLSALRNGLSYVNIHTAAFPGGEIRGQFTEVTAIPEPETYALMLAGLGLVGLAVRRKRKTPLA